MFPNTFSSILGKIFSTHYADQSASKDVWYRSLELGSGKVPIMFSVLYGFFS